MRSDDNLKAEYLLIQSQYEAFDQRALTMKGLAGPLLGVAVAYGAAGQRSEVLWATILAATALWLLEAMWKGFQYCLADRIKLLEAWFRGEGREDEAPFQIYTSWVRAYDRGVARITVARMLAPFVCLPYVIIIVLSTAILVHPIAPADKPAEKSSVGQTRT